MQVDETRVDGSPDSFLLGTPTASGKVYYFDKCIDLSITQVEIICDQIGATNCPVGYLVIGDAAHCGSLLANDDANTQPGSTYGESKTQSAYIKEVSCKKNLSYFFRYGTPI